MRIFDRDFIIVDKNVDIFYFVDAQVAGVYVYKKELGKGLIVK